VLTLLLTQLELRHETLTKVNDGTDGAKLPRVQL